MRLPGRSASSARSAWDLCLARRALAVGGLVATAALIVVAATDGGGSWPARIGMTSALMPLAGAFGTLLAVRTAASRGELLALAAVGVAPSRATRGASIGGAIVGLAGAALAASPLVDLASLFPRGMTAVWIVDGLGAYELTHRLRVFADGTLRFDADLAAPPLAVSSPLAGVTALVLAVTALAAPLWVAAPSMSRGRRGAVGGSLLVLGIASFQAVAADRAPSYALLLAPLALLADAARSAIFKGSRARPASSEASSRAPR